MIKLPINTEVYHIHYGKGIVRHIFNDGYGIYFPNLEESITFDLNGQNMDEYPISLTKYNLINGGFTSILDYGKIIDS